MVRSALGPCASKRMSTLRRPWDSVIAAFSSSVFVRDTGIGFRVRGIHRFGGSAGVTDGTACQEAAKAASMTRRCSPEGSIERTRFPINFSNTPETQSPNTKKDLRAKPIASPAVDRILVPHGFTMDCTSFVIQNLFTVQTTRRTRLNSLWRLGSPEARREYRYGKMDSVSQPAPDGRPLRGGPVARGTARFAIRIDPCLIERKRSRRQDRIGQRNRSYSLAKLLIECALCHPLNRGVARARRLIFPSAGFENVTSVAHECGTLL
jgi:hypothetical protein